MIVDPASIIFDGLVKLSNDFVETILQNKDEEDFDDFSRGSQEGCNY